MNDVERKAHEWRMDNAPVDYSLDMQIALETAFQAGYAAAQAEKGGDAMNEPGRFTPNEPRKHNRGATEPVQTSGAELSADEQKSIKDAVEGGSYNFVYTAVERILAHRLAAVEKDARTLADAVRYPKWNEEVKAAMGRWKGDGNGKKA